MINIQKIDSFQYSVLKTISVHHLQNYNGDIVEILLNGINLHQCLKKIFNINKPNIYLINIVMRNQQDPLIKKLDRVDTSKYIGKNENDIANYTTNKICEQIIQYFTNPKILSNLINIQVAQTKGEELQISFFCRQFDFIINIAPEQYANKLDYLQDLQDYANDMSVSEFEYFLNDFVYILYNSAMQKSFEKNSTNIAKNINYIIKLMNTKRINTSSPDLVLDYLNDYYDIFNYKRAIDIGKLVNSDDELYRTTFNMIYKTFDTSIILLKNYCQLDINTMQYKFSDGTVENILFNQYFIDGFADFILNHPQLN